MGEETLAACAVGDNLSPAFQHESGTRTRTQTHSERRERDEGSGLAMGAGRTRGAARIGMRIQ